jgi:DNA-binding PadR family transcriptional regulator
MSESRDKRRRSDLDLFILALIECGVSTPYELKTVADLSPGATIPALRRLVGGSLVVARTPGPRGRTGYAVTTEGRRYLKSGWCELITAGPSGDLDADLRVALLALWIGGNRRLAADFLRQSSHQRLVATARVDEPASLPPLALWYRRLRSASAQALGRGESAAALAMARALPNSGSGKRRKARATPKS